MDIQTNGKRPWDIQVDNPDFFNRVLGEALALGESYMDGWWQCEALDQFFDRILREGIDKQVKKEKHILSAILRAKIINAQSKSTAYITPADKYPQVVIPAKAGTQKNTGCRIKSGMTELAI